MRDLNQTEYEIVKLLTRGNRPKRNSRSVTYILWNGTVESCQFKKAILCPQHS